MPTYNPYTDTHAIEKYQFLHHFLPHPETTKRAKLLQHKALFTYSLVAAFLLVLIRVLPLLAPGVLGYASDITVSDLLIETNEMRNEHGLNSLRLNPQLTAAAEQKAAHMFENDYWAHVAPDGTTPWDFILNSSYDYSYAGENLAKNFNKSPDVVEAWFQSPTHRENLLSSHYEEIGFAVMNGVLDGYETTLVVQMFGKPRAGVPIATETQEETILEELAVAPEPEPVIQKATIPQVVEDVDLAFVPPVEPEAVLPAVDVTTATKSITVTVAGFLVLLLVLDIWYTKRKAIPKITGNAFAHIMFLVITVVGVWFALSPGKIL